MNNIKLQLICGTEFWSILESLLKNAKKRVFIFSAYVKESTYKKYMNMIPNDVYRLFMCREKDKWKGKEKENQFVPTDDYVVILSNEEFHGKVYLIDDTIIITSQNLTEAIKLREGEFGILIQSPSSYISLLLYKILQSIIRGHNIPVEPVSDVFFELYSNCCPFCGQEPTSDNIVQCQQYGFNFVSKDDCDSYDNEGACKYCNRDEQDCIDAVFCDDSGCGFGISTENKKFITHAINPPTPEEKNAAENYIRLFHFLENEEIDAVEAFEKLGINGEVYEANLKGAQTFVPIDEYNRLLNKCKNLESKTEQ